MWWRRTRQQQCPPWQQPAAALGVTAAVLLSLLLFLATSSSSSPSEHSDSNGIFSSLRQLLRSSSSRQRQRRKLWAWNIHWAGNPTAITPPPVANKHPNPPAQPSYRPPQPSYRPPTRPANPNRPPGNPFEKIPSPSSNSRPPPSPPTRPSNPRPPGNPFENANAGSSPSSSSSNNVPSGPRPPPSSMSLSSNNQGGGSGQRPSASQMISAASNNPPPASNNPPPASNIQPPPTRPQQQQVVATSAAAAVVTETTTTSFTSSIELRGIPTTLPPYGTSERTRLFNNLIARIQSAIEASSSNQVEAEVTILSIGGIPVSSRLRRLLSNSEPEKKNDDDRFRLLQTATQEVKYKAELEYKCNSRLEEEECAKSAKALAKDIVKDLSPSPSTPTNNYVDNEGEDWTSSATSTNNSNGNNNNGQAPSPSFVWLPTPSSSSSNNNNIQIISTPPPTPLPTYQKFAGDASKRYCGYGWGDVIQNCLTATPCPQGFAQGVCPNGMSCIADTPCSDPTWLDYLSGSSSSSSSSNAVQQQEGNMQSNSSPASTGTISMNYNEGVLSCQSDSDCRPYNQFCTGSGGAGSYCVSCLQIGNKGCRASEICATNSRGIPSCFDRPSELESTSNKEVDQQQQPQPMMMYQNPQNNNLFCGFSYSTITNTCLSSKPCPSGVAAVDCDMNEGCFVHPTCKSQYDSAAATASAGISSMSAFAAFDITETEMLLQPKEEEEKEEVAPNTEEAKTSFRTTQGTIGLLNSSSSYMRPRQFSFFRLACSLCAVWVLGVF